MRTTQIHNQRVLSTRQALKTVNNELYNNRTVNRNITMHVTCQKTAYCARTQNNTTHNKKQKS
jgi:hypothetical protein